MRFSTLTVVVFVAHTSTLALAAPLPFHDDNVQELVARNNKGPPASTSSTPASRWKEAAKKVAKAVPPKLITTPVHNNVASVVQKVVGAAANAGSSQNSVRPLPRPTPRKSQSQQASPIKSHWMKISPSAFQRPGVGSKPGPVSSPILAAVAKLRKTQVKGPKLRKRDLEIDELD